jgi:hypothetical protein
VEEAGEEAVDVWIGVPERALREGDAEKKPQLVGGALAACMSKKERGEFRILSAPGANFSSVYQPLLPV